jgi:hypothetical protein
VAVARSSLFFDQLKESRTMSALIKKLAPLAAFACAMLLPVVAFAQDKAGGGEAQR